MFGEHGLSCFLCLECSHARETPVCGYVLLLPSDNPLAPSPSHNEEPSPSHEHVDTSTRCTSITVGSSVRVALRESLLELQRHQATTTPSTQACHPISASPGTKRRPLTITKGPVRLYHSQRTVPWDRCPTGYHCPFRVAGGFHTSSIKSNCDIFTYLPPDSIHKGSGRWVVQPCPALPPSAYSSVQKQHVPVVHSEMACVIPRYDTTDTDSNIMPVAYEVWAFPQRRDALTQRGRGKEVAFDSACVLATAREGSEEIKNVWIWRDLQGEVPCRRVGAAFCYSSVLRGLVLHGGITVLSEEVDKAGSRDGEEEEEEGVGKGRGKRNRRCIGWRYVCEEEGGDEGGDDNETIERNEGRNTRRTSSSTVYTPVSSLHFLSTDSAKGQFSTPMPPCDHWVDLSSLLLGADHNNIDKTATTFASRSHMTNTMSKTIAKPIPKSTPTPVTATSTGDTSAPPPPSPSPGGTCPGSNDTHHHRATHRTMSMQSGSLRNPSPRHGHSISEIGGSLWLFGGIGVDLVHNHGRKSHSGRKHLNDLYSLDLLRLKATGGGTKVKRPLLLQWKMPAHNGAPPRRRAGHTAVAMGPQLIICGGMQTQHKNAFRYM